MSFLSSTVNYFCTIDYLNSANLTFAIKHLESMLFHYLIPGMSNQFKALTVADGREREREREGRARSALKH